MGHLLMSNKFESLQSIQCGHASLDSEAARLHIKETVGKSSSQTDVRQPSQGQPLSAERFPHGLPLKGDLLCQAPAARPQPAVERCCLKAWYPTETPLLWCRAGSPLLHSLPPGAFRRVLSHAANQGTQRQLSVSGSL